MCHHISHLSSFLSYLRTLLYYTHLDLSSDETLRAAGSDGNEKYDPKDLSKPGPHYGCNKSEEAPSGWDEPGAYNSVLVQIWTLWLVFVALARDIPTIQNRPVKFIPPWLPWHAPTLGRLLVLWLHFCPTSLENGLGGRHPAAATWHQGFLPLVSATWDLVRLALGAVYWRTIKLNVIPFQFPYGGQPSDVYTEENYKRLMNAYRKFVEGVVAIVDSNMFCSIGAMKRMIKDVFGGKVVFDRFVKKHRSKFLSLDPCVHPERLLNPMFHGYRLALECELFDAAYSEALKFLGVATACVVAMNIYNCVKDSPAYLLKKAASAGALARARAWQLMAWIAHWDGCPDEEQEEFVRGQLKHLEDCREWQHEARKAYRKGKADAKQTKFVEDQLKHLEDCREWQREAREVHRKGKADEKQTKFVEDQLKHLEDGREWMDEAREVYRKGKADEKQKKYVEDQLKHLEQIGQLSAQRRSAAQNKAIGLTVSSTKTLRSTARTRCPACGYEENTRGTVPANKAAVRVKNREFQIFFGKDSPTGPFQTFRHRRNAIDATGAPQLPLLACLNTKGGGVVKVVQRGGRHAVGTQWYVRFTPLPDRLSVIEKCRVCLSNYDAGRCSNIPTMELVDQSQHFRTTTLQTIRDRAARKP